jgi:hypothetical protein
VGENPPQGAIIDYWLGAAPHGPVTLEIRDSAGNLVRSFSSADQPEKLAAERYFAEDWVKPQPVLAASTGAHRWIWDLRSARPKAVEYSYSIAAVWGKNTPLLPEGPMVAPGRYTAVLSVDGRQQSQSFDVLPDPRVTDADYAGSTRFSAALVGPMAKAWAGYGETEAVRKQLEARIPQLRDPSLKTQAEALAAKLKPSNVPNSGFDGESGTLASLESTAEASDSAPSQGMQSIAAETIASLDADWDKWQQIKSGDLAALNRRLTAAGLAPITVPVGAALSVEPAGGGVDLP